MAARYSYEQIADTAVELALEHLDKAVHLTDVARRLGASPTTISRYVGGAKGLGEIVEKARRGVVGQAQPKPQEAAPEPVQPEPQPEQEREALEPAGAASPAPVVNAETCRELTIVPQPVATLDPSELEREAYFLWLQRGAPIGDAMTDWVEAERRLRVAG
jgi:AcrR family transcriptional regulator